MLLPIALVICIPLVLIYFYIGAHICLTVYAVRVQYCMLEKGVNTKYLNAYNTLSLSQIGKAYNL